MKGGDGSNVVPNTIKDQGMANTEITMKEKREIIRGQTFHSHAISEANQEQGRFANLNRVEVTGVPSYPRISGPWAQSIDEVCGPEPLSDQTDCGDRLGYPIDGNEPAMPAPSDLPSPPAQALGRGSAYAPAPPASKSPTRVGGAPQSFRRRI
jgi:hypothetical protein